MANHALPTTTSLYTDVLTNLKDRIDDSLKMLDSVNTSPTNVPTNAVRFNSSTFLWEKYNGSSWVSLASSYAIQVLKSTNIVGGNSTTLLGSIPYQSNTNITSLLPPNTTTTRKFLRQTGSGTNGSAPVWDTILVADIPTLNQNTTGSSGSCTGNSATATTATTATTANALNTANDYTVKNITASGSVTVGQGGSLVAGSIYSDPNWGIMFMAKQANPAMGEFVWMNSVGTELFRFASGKLTANITGSSASCTGNSNTATTLVGDQTNWASYRSHAVANMLGWKNYGNGHCIFDASNGTAPNGVAVNNTNAEFIWIPKYPTLMGWNGGETYGVRVDSARVADSTTYASAFTTVVGSAPSYACRAWVNFNGTGTVAIRASGNVSSITDNGVGNYTVNFTTAMPDANYNTQVTGSGEADASVRQVGTSINTYSTSAVKVYTGTDNTILLDHTMVNVTVFR